MHSEMQQNGRILLAEDDEINSELYGMALERAGYCVRYASNGKNALEALREEAFDCVLMDIEMNVLNGLEATRRIRTGQAGEQNRAIPIIGMSAHEGDLVSQFVSAGINTFLYKPIELDLLETTVAAVMRGGSQKKDAAPANPATLSASSSLDRAGALNRLKNNNKLLEKITDQVLGESEDLVRTLRDALGEADYETAGHLAHRYAGSLASIGAMTASLICREISTLARRGFTAHLERLTSRLEQELLEVHILLRQDNQH